jgi:hypothetical protein
MAMLVTDTCREMLSVFPGLRIMAVYRKFKRYFANDHCCWYLLSTPVELVPRHNDFRWREVDPRRHAGELTKASAA